MITGPVFPADDNYIHAEPSTDPEDAPRYIAPRKSHEECVAEANEIKERQIPAFLAQNGELTAQRMEKAFGNPVKRDFKTTPFLLSLPVLQEQLHVEMGEPVETLLEKVPM